MILKAAKHIREFRSGSSLPLLIEANDGQLYVVKLHGSGEGKISMLTSMISSRVAGLLNIKILPEKVIDFNPAIIPRDADPEIIELANRSSGLNTATRFLPDAITFSPSSTILNKSERDFIFLADLLLMNIDRTSKNPNILCFGGSVYCYDYSMSMNVRGFFENTVGDRQKLLSLMNRHLFYNKEVSTDNFISRIKSLRKAQIQFIIEAIPREWMRDVSAPSLSDEVFNAITDVDGLQRMLELLRQLPRETEEEIRQKNLVNRRTFMDKFGKI